MLSRGEKGSVVTLICDGGDRYAGTYYNDEWVQAEGLDLEPYTRRPSPRPRRHGAPDVAAARTTCRERLIEAIAFISTSWRHRLKRESNGSRLKRCRFAKAQPKAHRLACPRGHAKLMRRVSDTLRLELFNVRTSTASSCSLRIPMSATL
jgi:hypothetical protein